MGKSVSVIIAAYNAADTIEKCLESVTAQTYENIEIIVVNDGSTDGTEKKALLASSADRRIRVISRANGGAAAARNTGLDAAGGDYITFVDADDWVEPVFCAALLELAESNGAALACCGLRSHGMTAGNFNPEESPSADNGAVRVFEGEEALFNVRFNNCGKLFSKKLFEGSRYPEGRRFEDEFLIYRLVHRAQKAACTARQLYNRNVRQGSLTRSGPGAGCLDLVEALKQRSGYAAENGLERFRLFTDKSLVGTIAGLMVAAKKGRSAENYRLLNRLKHEFSEATLKFKRNRDYTLRQRLEGMFYIMAPEAAVFAAGLKKKFFRRQWKKPKESGIG